MRYLLILAFVLFAQCLVAQSWQWGKRGGSTDMVSNGLETRIEGVYSMVTDSENNVYTLSSVGVNNVDVSGVSRSAWGDNDTKTDFILASFSCDGTYRWSKVIGGGGLEVVNPLSIDSNDNLYVTGKFANCDEMNPSRIDDDVILDNFSGSSCRLLFLTKYNKDGMLIWLRFPEALVPLSTTFGQTGTYGSITDDIGNTYFLSFIPPGEYADGAFVNSIEGSRWHILKYDTNGNFIGAIYLDLLQNLNVNLKITFYRNPYNGHFYLLGDRLSNQEATMGGEPIGEGFFMASFDDQGQYLWRRQAVGTGSLLIRPYNLLFDSENNIYFGGVITGLNSVSFLNYSVAPPISAAFLMKLNPVADTIEYVSNCNKSSSFYGSIVFNGDEIGLSGWCGSPNYSWGSQTINVGNPGEGTKPLLATFNKDTGACSSLTFIPATIGSQNIGASIAVDSSGDYIIGGSFDGTQTYANNTITSIGGQSDFFVAKYATSPCSLNVEEEEEQELKLYPNPVKDQLQIDGLKGNVLWEIYSITGQQVLSGTASDNQSTIEVSRLAAGTYILKVQNQDVSSTQFKVIKL